MLHLLLLLFNIIKIYLFIYLVGGVIDVFDDDVDDDYDYDEVFIGGAATWKVWIVFPF